MLLEIENLAVQYAGALRALRKVDLAVASGRIVAVLGNNGAGKTTLLRAVSGTLELYAGRIVSGQVRYEGHSITNWNATKIVHAGISQVPEGRRIFRGMTVAENLRAGGFATRDSQARAKGYARVRELFPVLREREDQMASLLSGGEQQMLAIGRALMGSPKVLLLDEPSLGLAPLLVAKVSEAIRAIADQGIAVILVEQNARVALSLANDAIVLNVGEVVMAGEAAKLKDSQELQRLVLGKVGSV